MNILYDDEFIAVAIKPAGLVSEEGKSDSFPDRLAKELSSQRGTDIAAYPVHRLDKETEGIMVYALSSNAAAILSRDITEGKWQKTYLALLCASPEKSSDVLHDLLFYDRNRGKSFVVDRERKGVKDASLEYEVLGKNSDGYTAVKIKLHTGRTHQIRVQFASRKLFLCGDRKYGAPASSGNKLALCSSELTLYHPISREKLEFKIDPSGFSIE